MFEFFFFVWAASFLPSPYFTPECRTALPSPFPSPLLFSAKGENPRMQQRRAVALSGRPSGTDGSDFSYRMVVDSRYTKVAKGKSRLASLIVAQAFNQVIGFLLVFLSISREHEVDKLAIFSISAGLVSLLIGELGRRRSQVILLRLYTGLSSTATLSSVGSFVRSDLFTKAIHCQTKAITTDEIVGAGHVLLGVLLQAIVISTTVALVHNMSPKRAS